MRHRNPIKPILFPILLLVAASSVAHAEIVSGSFDRLDNPALISSNGYDDIGPAQSGPDGDVARNVAVYRLDVATAGTVLFTSTGYSDGGGTPDGGAIAYFSLFRGSDTAATFIDSSYDDASNDFQRTEALDSGVYLFTIGVYFNESFAEQDAPTFGTLSEGFIGLGSYFGDGFYEVDVTPGPESAAAFSISPAALPGSTGPTNPIGVPEPDTAALLGLGLAACGAWRRRRPPFQSPRSIIRRPRMNVIPRFFRRAGMAVLLAGCTAGGLLASHDASAQSRPALTRDADNADLAPVFFGGSYAVSTAPSAPITTVPAGKRLVIDFVTFAYTATQSNDQIVQAFLYTNAPAGSAFSNQVRLYFPIAAPHGGSGGPYFQDGAFAGRTYFESGEKVYFIAGNSPTDSSKNIAVTITGHYVTP